MRIQFDEKELKILETLNQKGAMSPSQVSATTWVIPTETMSLLEMLNKEGMVRIGPDSHSPDGKMVAITHQASNLLNKKDRKS
jgi:DNA-binding IclR family transcriptional regulator